jgi:glycosyltransferase involved in cell wall biosynthesis
MSEPIQHLISIITPCLNEQDNVNIFYREISRVFSQMDNCEFELIFVDDGSTDETVSRIREIIKLDSRCKLLINARNFGVYRSSFNALKYAKGNAVIPLLPVDLQDPPELIPRFYSEWINGTKIVAGVRYEREENFILRGIRRLYYRVASTLADFDLPRYVGEFQLVDMSVIQKLKDIDDYYPYTRGLIAAASNSRVQIEYTWKKRKIGKSNMNMWRLIDQGINGIVSTSASPLRLVSILSTSASVIGGFFGILQLIAHFTFAKSFTAPGISTLIVLISFFFMVNSITLGVLAEYISAIHAQVRGKGRVIVSERVNVEDPI